jgi:hypothetical protein
MVFDLRHAETPDPMELFRMGGENSMLWTAEPWTDTPSGQADESLDRILAVLSKDRMARFKARAIEDMVGIKRTALYGKLCPFGKHVNWGKWRAICRKALKSKKELDISLSSSYVRLDECA